MNRSHLRLTLPLVALATALLVVAGAGPAASSAPRATAKVCEIDDDAYPGDGYFTGGYFTARGVGCRTGKKVMIAYYKCRMRNGGKKGKCPSSKTFRGGYRFKCKERRVSVIETEFNAKVTCRRPGAEIVHTYQQNT